MQPMPTPRRGAVVVMRVEGGGVRVELVPSAGRSASRQAARPALASRRWPAVGGVAGAQRIDVAELEPVDAGLGGEVVDQSVSCAMAACGTPKPRKAPEGVSLV